MRDIRGGEISIIFQEPMTSLSALHTVGDQIGEAVELHGGGGHLDDFHSLGNQMHEAAERSRVRMTPRRDRRADQRHAAAWSASPIPSGRCAPIRSSCRAACASAP